MSIPRSAGMRRMWLAMACIVAPRLLAASGPCSGRHAETAWFRDIVAFIPLAAEPHPDDMKLTFGRLAQYEYARSKGDRLGADFDVGAEFPIVACVSPRIAAVQAPPLPGEYRFGLFIPVSFHMLWDLR